jgi:serine protease Do
MLNHTLAIGLLTGWHRMRKAGLPSLLLLVLAGVAQAKPPENLTPAQIAERATNSVALIKVDGAVGTGFVVAEDGRLATNIHVIRGAVEATVVMADGKEYKDVEVVATDEDHDLAILRIAARKLKPLRLGDSSKVKPGEHVVAIGHPLGLGNTVSDGLVSAVREISPRLTVVQISAPISPGSSGGPVFNDRGEVIGVSTLVATQGQNLNFAMPVNTLKAMLNVKKGMSIAEFAAKDQREGGDSSGRQRKVPDHPVALLESCPAASQRAIASGILDAIDVGAPLYNRGNVQACYRVYSAAAVDIDRTVTQCEGPRRALLDGLKNADSMQSWEDKAWAMRDAFDGVLDVISRQGDISSAAPQPQQTFKRRVPQHSDTLLDDCDQADIENIGNTIIDAIDSGAPLYNDGNTEACYRIYEGAISQIDRRINECKAAKQALRDGLATADERTDWAAKAWAVRDSFDGVLQVIRRKLEAAVEQR